MTIILIRAISAATGIGLAILAGAAIAQEHPCSGDLSKYCPAVMLGSGRQINCLAAHDRQLTAACRGTLVQRGILPSPTVLHGHGTKTKPRPVAQSIAE